MLKRLSFALLLTTALALAADVTGKWTANVETDSGSGTPSFTFKQSGETITGTYSGLFGEAPVTGTVKGDDIEFGFQASQDGETIKVKYKGKITGATQMKGTVDLGSIGTGTFTATKR